MPVFFVVRAVVMDATQRPAFDAWYRDDHLPWAMREFGAQASWRFWSEGDPSVHQAMYRFADKAAAERAINSEGMKALVEDFDRAWPGVTRTRELLTLVEERDAVP